MVNNNQKYYYGSLIRDDGDEEQQGLLLTERRGRDNSTDAAAVPSSWRSLYQADEAEASERKRGSTRTNECEEIQTKRKSSSQQYGTIPLLSLASLLLGVSLLTMVAVSLYTSNNSPPSSRTALSPLDLDRNRNSWLVLVSNHFRSHPHHHNKIKDTLTDLQKQLTGTILFRDDDKKDTFEHAWEVWNKKVTHPPFAVIEAADAYDVSLSLPVLAHIESKYKVPFTIKSGGHNYAGWSAAPNGIVLSLSKLNPFDLHLPDDSAAGSSEPAIATIGPGTTDGDILKQGLLELGYGGVVGSSSAVSMGGWVLGGGVGYWSRRYGLGIDNLISAEVVLPDGQVVTATDSNEYSDLLWAMKGAGQANLGVATGYQYKLYPAQDEILLVAGHLPYHLAAHALTKIGIAEPTFPGSIFLEVNSDENGLTMSLFCIGETEQVLLDGQKAIEDLLHDILPSDVAESFSYDRTSWYQSAVDETAEFDGFLVQDWNGFLVRSDSEYDNWKKIMDFYDKLKGNPYILVDIELFGGAVGDAEPDSTAFPWRDGLYSVGVMVLVPATTKHADSIFNDLSRKVDRLWHHKLAGLLQGTFVNYAMTSETDEEQYAKIAWGANLNRLQKIKAKYDPEDVMHSALSIPVSKKG